MRLLIGLEVRSRYSVRDTQIAIRHSKLSQPKSWAHSIFHLFSSIRVFALVSFCQAVLNWDCEIRRINSNARVNFFASQLNNEESRHHARSD